MSVSRNARCCAEGPGHSDFLDLYLTNALVEGTLDVLGLRRCGDTTDRDMLPSERREFGRTHRTCVFGYPRHNDGPAMSVVYYVPTDDDELFVSTMAGCSKTLAVAEQEQRVVLRCRPYSTFAQPPRHLHRNDHAERLTHWISEPRLGRALPVLTSAQAAEDGDSGHSQPTRLKYQRSTTTVRAMMAIASG